MFSVLYSKWSCCNCQEDIQGLRVHCHHCTDFHLCLPCFAAGAEIGPHKNDHPYQFMDSGTVGIFQGRGNWSAKEEVRLLDAIEQFGFGNWEDISKHIETRTPEEAKDEYISRYLEGSIGRATWGGVEAPIRPAPPCSSQDEGPLGPDAVNRLAPLEITSEEAQQLSYMPNRDDFEREFDHEAEQIISSLSITTEDDDLDIALKLSQVDMYTRRLRERTRRKRLVRDYQLVQVFFNNLKNKGKLLSKMAKEKKDFLDRQRPFSRFLSRSEHTSFSEGLWRERELRARIGELIRYRRYGITRVEECAHFERHAVAGGVVRDGESRLTRNPDTPVNGRALAVAARMAGSSGCIAPSNPTQLDHSPTAAAALAMQQNQRKRESEVGSSSSISPRSIRDASTVCGCCRRPSCSSISNSSSCNVNSHLLTSYEKELCNTLNVPPLRYITMKTIFLKGHSSSPDRHGFHIKPEHDGDNANAESVIQRYLQANSWVMENS